MIRSDEDIREGLDALARLDPRLVPAIALAGRVPLRRGEEGLAGLARTIVAQQVSKASAEAIFRRLSDRVALREPAAILAATDEDFRLAGLSRSKQATLAAIAEAAADGRLDFERIGRAEPAAAVAELVALRGIGLWTAECYLLFCAGHRDIFPAGDLALRIAVGHALALPGRPAERAVTALAAAWSPYRSVAARMFWAYYHAITRRDAAPAEFVEAQG